MKQSFRTVTDAERRARLGIRHVLAQPVADPLAAARAVVCLHATEPSSVYISAYVRSGASRADVDRAIYKERSLVRQLAMRRTVFAFPRDLLPAVRGSAAARVATQQAAQLARSVEAAGLATDGYAWVRRACEATLAQLREAPATTRQLRERLPALAERLPPTERGSGAKPVPVASRLMTVLAAGGDVVRGDNDGNWMISRPTWTLATTWLGTDASTLGEADGYAELARRWLWAFGPGTEADLTWWLGATKKAVRRALDDVGAVAITLGDGSPAWLHPDDLDEVRAPEPWAALLPALDPTTMGWRRRGFYVDESTTARVYDSAGNGRPTAWWNGHIVGTWGQRSDGTVVLAPAKPLTTDATTHLRRAATDLSDWLDGAVIRTSLQKPLT